MGCKEDKLIICIGIVVIVICLAVYNDFKTEEVWGEINSKYIEITNEIELCVYSCSLECEIFPSTCDFDEMKKCFHGCDIKLNKSLEEIGIKHEAWREKYVRD